MKKQKKAYTDAFKEQAINLLRSSDRSASDIERELGITQGLLSRWNRQKAKAEGEVIAPRAKRPLAEEPLEERVKYLLHDNDGKFGSRFKKLVKDSGIKAIKTPPKAPRANAICERFIGSLKRECTDNFLVLHTHQLNRIVSIYAEYFNQHRPHQGIDQHIPSQLDKPLPSPNYQLKGKVVATPVLNGLFHSYSYVH